MARKPLNPRQVEVLRWVAGGCPEGVMVGETHKVSAAALKSRHLVKVSKRDGWQATITEEGRRYLEHGGCPDEPEPLKAPVVERSPRPVGVRPRSKPPAPSAASKPMDQREASAAGEMAEREQSALKLPPVPVPVQLRQPHPVVASLQNEKQHFAIVGAARRRALRIVQGLIVAAEREGYTVKPIPSTQNGYGYTTWESTDHFTINTGECKVSVRVLQDKDRTPHVPTERELAEQKRSAWPRQIPKYDHTTSERLRIDIGRTWGSGAGRQHSWGDGRRASLEESLPDVLAEIALRHAEEREDRIEGERKESEYQRLWQIEIDKANVLLRESNRAVVLQQQAVDWRRSQDLREYVQAMEVAVSRLTDPDQKADGLAWLAWAREYPDRIDPLLKRIGLPEDPEPTDEALRPFLAQPPRRDWQWWRT